MDKKPKQRILTESFDRLAQRQGSEYLSKISKPNPEQYQNKSEQSQGEKDE